VSHRRLLSFLLIFLATAAGFSQQTGSTAPPTTVDWPFFAFAVNGGSYNPLETALTTQNVSTLTMKFQYATSNAVISFAPVIGNGVAYFSAGDGTLNAVDAATGALLWKKTIGAAGSPCYSNGVVYVSLGRNMYALNATTGKAIWKVAVTHGVSVPPVVANGLLYFDSQDRNVYALNIATGALVWKYATGSQVFNFPVVANGVVYVGSQDRYLYALNATTGTLVWKYGLRAYPVGEAVVNGVVYAATTNSVAAIDAVAGTLIWQDAYNTGGISVANGVAYVCQEGGQMSALDTATGNSIWRNTTSCIGSGPAVVANGVLYQSGQQGGIQALDAADGSVLWSDQLGSVVGNRITPAVVVNGMVYVAGNSPQTLYAFGLP